jgi:hypothetical protein
VPTFARIEVDGDDLVSADVYFADDPEESLTTDGLLERLARAD